MAILDIFKRDKRKNPVYKFTEEDTERSHISRQENLIKKKYNEIQLARLEHLENLIKEKQMNEKIAMMESELYDSDNEDEEDSKDPLNNVFNSFVGMLANKLGPQSQNTNPNSSVTSNPSVTDDTIKQTIDQIPIENIKQLQAMSSEQITELVVGKFPQLTSQQVVYAVSYIKSKSI